MLINPENLKARVDLAVFELGFNNLVAAEKHSAIALEQQPALPKALFYKAMVQQQQGQTASAREILVKLSQQNDEYGYKAKDFLKVDHIK